MIIKGASVLNSRTINRCFNIRYLQLSGLHKFGHIIGIYEDDKNILTPAGSNIDKETSGNFSKQLNYGGPLKEGKSRVLYGISESFAVVAAVGLGKRDYPTKPLEERDEGKEAIRTAVAAGCKALGDIKLDRILVDPCGDAEAAAEGGHLSLFKYQDLKSKKKTVPELFCLEESEGWKKGSVYATSQNIARRLMEMPSNILTPTNFAQEAVTHLEPLGVEVSVRTKEWAKERDMNAFLSVSKGSTEPPVFLELTYNGTDPSTKPFAIVGKGITFDTGGISLKPPGKMELMRGDMGGAACTVGALHSIASLKLPINVKGFVPLCENMPGGSAIKPGDVVVASNGKSIQIDNTDAEGRLILADALHYASQHSPRAIIDMATLTGAMMSALGAGPTGVFTNSSVLWETMHKAGSHTGDRVWRMPLWKLYSSHVTESSYADVNNVGKHAREAGASTAAAFLQEFVTCDHWMHLDIAGVMENSDHVPYLGKGMSGRPTRTIAQFASLLAQGKLNI